MHSINISKCARRADQRIGSQPTSSLFDISQFDLIEPRCSCGGSGPYKSLANTRTSMKKEYLTLAFVLDEIGSPWSRRCLP